MSNAGRVLVVVALLAASPVFAQTSEPRPDACGSRLVKGYVGKVATKARLAAIRKRATPGSVRVIRPNMAVTMDYREDRLNVSVDKRSIIRRLTCG